MRSYVAVGHRLSVARLSALPTWLAYRCAVAVGEQDVTRPSTRHDAWPGVPRGSFPWWAVVAPWLLSRVISVGCCSRRWTTPQLGIAVHAARDQMGRFATTSVIARARLRAGRRRVPAVAVLPRAPGADPRARRARPRRRADLRASTSSRSSSRSPACTGSPGATARRAPRCSRCGRSRCSRRRSCSR